MANFTLEQLLTYPPLEAMMIAYNEVYGTQFNPRYIAVDNVVGGVGQDIVVRLKPFDIVPGPEVNRFEGTCDITVKRLNLAEFFPRPFVIDYFGEIVTSDVAKYITERTGIVFSESDFDSEVLTPDNPILRASVNSLRWYGQMTIQKA